MWQIEHNEVRIDFEQPISSHDGTVD